MRIYFYYCNECGNEDDFIVMANAQEHIVKCTKCGSTDVDSDSETESQSSKHYDLGYMNDVRFGESGDGNEE